MEQQANIEAAVIQDLKKETETPFLKRIKKNSRIYKHNFRYERELVFVCDLKGCNQEFSVKVLPGQILYPRFCEDHRSEYRRKRFLKKHD